MTSDKAWRVKTRGNRKEDIFADLIKGIVLKGTKKPDVMNSYRQFFSVKGVVKNRGERVEMGEYKFLCIILVDLRKNKISLEVQ